GWASPASSHVKASCRFVDCLVFGRIPPPRLPVVPCVCVFGPSRSRWSHLGGELPIGERLQNGTMASADFCHPLPPHCCSGSQTSLAGRQISRNKSVLFRPAPAGFTSSQSWERRVSLSLANSPTARRLISDFCSSGRDCGSGFLQTPPR